MNEIKEFEQQLEYKIKLRKYLTEELEKVKKAWLKSKNYQNTWIRLDNIAYQESFEVKSVGDKYRSKPGEKDFAEYEIQSRCDTILEIWVNNYENPNFFIHLTPLTSGYDYMIENNGQYSFFESKSRSYKSDSSVIKDGVAIEQTKVEESFRDGYYQNFFYINKFSDGNIYTWHLDSLPKFVWCPRVVSYPDSTLKYNRMKEKIVYYLPLNLRIKVLDMKCY